MKNIGFTKKFAQALAKSLNTKDVEAYAQKEEGFFSALRTALDGTYQWVVVLQKRGKK